MAHRTMLFCDLWQELLGFGGDVPNEEAALSLQASYTQQRSSSRKTLSLLWKTPPAVAISDPLPPHSYQNFQDRLGSMERSLSKLNDTVSLIARALLPSTAAPHGVLPGLRQPFNSEASLKAKLPASQGDHPQGEIGVVPDGHGGESTAQIVGQTQQQTAALYRNATGSEANERPSKRMRRTTKAGSLEGSNSLENVLGNPDRGPAEGHPLARMRLASGVNESDSPEHLAGRFHSRSGPAESEVPYAVTARRSKPAETKVIIDAPSARQSCATAPKHVRASLPRITYLLLCCKPHLISVWSASAAEHALFLYTSVHSSRNFYL
ncbi:hypothetical protein CY34DRAFT_15901 [Suillus luteus UH-Slu-Lm8-n1]|uniref:Uncharacterized protein n=1 Tax=Suillus luteus UH-Slu-Lm8-n1 TaxID=930992 RepID=A0A0D0ASD0_9AGAM|nr:hypothetical protein CY34DRAFT_15901 [Suillus luteus UH-Slu-Lm8-n1]